MNVFIRKIEELAELTNSQRMKNRQNIKVAIQKRLNNPEILKANKNLFNFF